MKGLIHKLRSLPAGVKASVAFFLTSLVTKGISYITMPIYTRLMSTDEFGQMSVFMTWVSILGIIAMFGFANGVFNNGMLDYPEHRDQYSFSLLILSNIFSFIFCIILFILYPWLHKFIKIDVPVAIIMCLIFFLQPAYSFWSARQRYELKYKYSCLFLILSTLISQGIAIICICTTEGSRFLARVYGTEITLLAFYLIFYVYIAWKSKFKVNTIYWKTAFLFNLPLIPHYLSMYLLNSSDKLMISYLINDTATAYYSVAYSLAAILTVFWSAINTSLLPITYESLKMNCPEKVSKIASPILFSFAGMCLIAILLAPEAISLVATKNYMEAIYVIPTIVGGVFFQVQYYMYANVLFFYRKPKHVMFASITATVLNIVLNYIFIPVFGYIAAGYTTLICYLVQAGIDYFAMRRYSKENVYNAVHIAILSSVLMLVSLLGRYLYDYMLLRYMILACLLVLCIVFKNKFVKMIDQLKRKDRINESTVQERS